MVHAYNCGGMRSHSHHITQRWGMKRGGKKTMRPYRLVFQLRRGQGLKTWQTPAMLFNYIHHSKTDTEWAMGQKKKIYPNKIGRYTHCCP